MSYTKIENNVLQKLQQDKSMPAQTKMIYIQLLSYCYGNKNECFPTREQLATDCNVSVRTITTAVQQLADNNYITVKMTRNSAGNKKNIYIINDISKTVAETEPKITEEPKSEITEEPEEPKTRQYFAERCTYWTNKLAQGFATETDETLEMWKKKKDNCIYIISLMDVYEIYNYDDLRKHLITNNIQYNKEVII